MLDLHRELKALKPDEPDEEIVKDIQEIKRARPGISDEEILKQAQGLIVGAGKTPGATPPAAPSGPSPMNQPGDGGFESLFSPIPSAIDKFKAPEVPATRQPFTAEDDFTKPGKITGRDAAMAALQGLAGIGDAITGAYGTQKTDFLKTAMAMPDQELARRKAIAEEMRKNRGEDREDMKVGAEKIKAQLEAMKKAGKDTFEMEEKLRDGFTAASKTYATVRDQFGVLDSAASDPSAAGDLALIFAFMKIVDPGSTVREGEFANAQNAAGVPEQTRAMWNKALRGERLTTKTRADFVGRAKKLYGSYEQTFQKAKDQYNALADAYGLDKDRVTSIVVGQAPEAVSQGGAGSVQGKIMTATNKATLEKRISRDGGKTWERVPR